MMMSALTGSRAKPAVSADTFGASMSGSKKKSQPDDNPFALLMAALQINVNVAQQPVKSSSSTPSTGKSDTAFMTRGADHGYTKPSMTDATLNPSEQSVMRHGQLLPGMQTNLVPGRQTIGAAKTMPTVQITPKAETMAPKADTLAHSQAISPSPSLENTSSAEQASDQGRQVKMRVLGLQSAMSSQSDNTDELPPDFVRMLNSAGISGDDVSRVTTSSTVGKTQRIESVTPQSIPMGARTQDSSGEASSADVSQPHERHAHQVDLPSVSIVGSQSTGGQLSFVSNDHSGHKTVDWSMLDSDANRKFASLLAAHAGSSAGTQTLTVQVHPQGLGSLTVTVAQREAGLNVQIQASNVQTAQWLQTETGRLTQAVESAGLPVSGLQVTVSNGGSDERRGQSQGGETRRSVAASRNTGTSTLDATSISALVQGIDSTAQAISVRA
jgi:hypothetical protein